MPALTMHPAERLQVRLSVQGVAGAQSGRYPAAADVEHLALDALMRPDGHRLPVGVGESHFQRRVGQRQRAGRDPGPAAIVWRE